MPRSSISTPPIALMRQWRQQGEAFAQEQMRIHRLGGHPALVKALLEMYTQGYMQGRGDEWRKQQELASLQRSLDAGSPD